MPEPIRHAGPAFTNENAEKAIKSIFSDLEEIYKDGSDIQKRNNLALASFHAGSAFTRAMVGYVHAIAHNMGGLYGIPHGLANAVILPSVLERSRKDAEKKLARLAIAERARGEAHPLYPVSTFLNQKELEALIRKLLP